jgi:hypothetical protein
VNPRRTLPPRTDCGSSSGRLAPRRNNPLYALSNRHLLSNSEERIVKIPVFVMVLAAAMLAGLGLIFFVL